MEAQTSGALEGLLTAQVAYNLSGHALCPTYCIQHTFSSGVLPYSVDQIRKLREWVANDYGMQYEYI